MGRFFNLKAARRYYKVVDSLKADEMAKVFWKVRTIQCRYSFRTL